MSPAVLSVGPSHTLREAAQADVRAPVGAAVVNDPDGNGPGIITERDILLSLGGRSGYRHGDGGRARDERVVYAAPEWSLEEAASAMVRGSFRHLIVIEQGEITGILSVRESSGAGPMTERSAPCRPAPLETD